ncbi:MAG: hypothetical protein ACREPV_03720 [Lysobacter sp.]
MKPLPSGVLAAALLAASAPPAIAPAHAQSHGIQRCEAADGTAIYTDRACASLGATASPMSGELLTRLATSGGDLDPGMFGERRASAVARRSLANGCARSSTQLSMDLQGAWALGDVNRIAESYHWAGLGTDQARTIMQRLERLAAQPLWQAHYFDARIGGAMHYADAAAVAPPRAGVMQLLFADGASRQVQDFDVRRYHGCYFIQF